MAFGSKTSAVACFRGAANDNDLHVYVVFIPEVSGVWDAVDENTEKTWSLG